VIQVRLIDASFIWTEPHSKRIKVKLVVQKEVIFGLLLFYKRYLLTPMLGVFKILVCKILF